MASLEVNLVYKKKNLFFNMIYEWYGKDDSTSITYFDFSKPFDKVLHKILFRILEGYDIQANESKGIAEWVEDEWEKKHHKDRQRRVGWR